MPTDADPQVMAATLHAELLRRSAMIATAESLTGGALGDLLSAAPGASDTYLGGVVSAECAAEMAAGVRRLLDADVAVSTTGVAGPTEQEGKPVGTVFIGVASDNGVRTTRLDLAGDRASIREQTCQEAISAVLAVLVP